MKEVRIKQSINKSSKKVKKYRDLFPSRWISVCHDGKVKFFTVLDWAWSTWYESGKKTFVRKAQLLWSWSKTDRAVHHTTRKGKDWTGQHHFSDHTSRQSVQYVIRIWRESTGEVSTSPLTFQHGKSCSKSCDSGRKRFERGTSLLWPPSVGYSRENSVACRKIRW